MIKKTFGRLLSVAISLTMIITSVVPVGAAGEDTADVYFCAQNEENLPDTEADTDSEKAEDTFINEETEETFIDEETEEMFIDDETEDPENVTLTSGAEDEVEEIDEDMADTARLSSTTTTITFDANGGEDAYFHYYNAETSVYEDVQCVEFENKGNGRYDLGKLISNDLHWRLRGFSTDKNATWPEYNYYSDSTSIRLSDINSEENYTLYAVWEKNAYLVVTFNAGEDCYLEYEENGEIKRSQTWQVAVAMEDRYENDGVFYWSFEIPDCEVFYKDDTKLFSNWNVNGVDIGNVWNLDISEDTTFVACYEYPFTITLNAHRDKGGFFYTGDGQKTGIKTVYCTKAGMSLPAPQNDGNYSFDTWYEDEECTIAADLWEEKLHPKENTVLFAKWLKNCTVTFDPGAGTLKGTATFVLPEGKPIGEINVPWAVPASDDEIFVEWYTDKNFSEESRVESSKISNYVVRDGLTFYAKYSSRCLVTFDVGEDGTFVSKNGTSWSVTVPNGDVIGPMVPTVKPAEGKAFVGWFDSPGDEGKEIRNLYQYKVKGNVTLYAKYSDDCWRVTFNSNMEGAILDEIGETVTYYVPKGQQFGTIRDGEFTTSAPALYYDSAATGGKVAPYGEWTIKGDPSGERYIFGLDKYSCSDSCGKLLYYFDRGYIPTADTEFQLVWVDTVKVTFVTDDEHLFRDELQEYYGGGVLSEDNKTFTLAVPSGTRVWNFSDISESFVQNPPEGMYCRFRYDSAGNEYDDDSLITEDTTLYSGWIPRSHQIEQSITFHAGKGYFGNKEYPCQSWEKGYNYGGELINTPAPRIDDPDQVFQRWYLDKELQRPLQGPQEYSDRFFYAFIPSGVTDLYAGYGPASHVRISANGGYFEEGDVEEIYNDPYGYSYKIDPDVSTRSNTYYDVKLRSLEEGISLGRYASWIRHDGNVVFAGWMNERGEKVELTTTDRRSQVYVPDASGGTLYAMWSAYSVPDEIRLEDEISLSVGATADLGLSILPETIADDQIIKWGMKRLEPYTTVTEPRERLPIISISEDGRVTGINAGKVRVWAECNGLLSNFATITVTGDEPLPEPKAICYADGSTAIKRSLKGRKDNKLKLSVGLSEDYTASEVEWESSDTSVLSVTADTDDSKHAEIRVVDDVAEKKTVTITAKIKDNPELYVTCDVELTPDDTAGIIVSIPEANNAVYDGTEKSLVKAGATEAGTMLYAPSKSAYTAPGESAYKNTIPRETNAGTYYVWYKVVSIPGHKDILCDQPVEVIIDKAQNPAIVTRTASVARGEYSTRLLPLITGALGEISFAITGNDMGCRLSGDEFISGSRAGVVSVAVRTPEQANYKALDEIIMISVTASDENAEIRETGELEVRLADAESFTEDGLATYTYTGAAIKPDVIVTNGNKPLVFGTDYTLSYKNNIKASANTTAKKATVVIKGKGVYGGTHSVDFLIDQKDIGSEDVLVGNTTVLSGKVPAPTLTYKGITLKKKNDYTGVPATAITTDAGRTFVLTGAGNFTGKRTITMEVKEKKDIRSIAVTLNTKKISFTYNGDPKTLNSEQLIVTEKGASSNILKEGKDYNICYSANVNAGTVKVTVTGAGDYSGTVTKSFKINPVKTAKIAVSNADELENTGVFFNRLGAKPEIKLRADIDEKHMGIPLVLGEDFNVSYSGNTKVGTATAKITFIGNYKGTKAIKQSFSIKQAVLKADDIDLVVRDFTYNPKKKAASAYFAKNGSTMFVTLDGVLLNANEYTASFYQGDTALNSKSDLVFEADAATIRVVITPNPKNKNYVADSDSTVSAEYKVVRTADLLDVSSAKVKVVRKDNPAKAATIGYTGQPITFDKENIGNQGAYLRVDIKNGNNTITLIENGEEGRTQVSDYFSIRYVNNVRKGTARIVLTPKNSSKYSGSAIGSFTIKNSAIADRITEWIRK